MYNVQVNDVNLSVNCSSIFMLNGTIFTTLIISWTVIN